MISILRKSFKTAKIFFCIISKNTVNFHAPKKKELILFIMHLIAGFKTDRLTVNLVYH